MTSLPGSAPRRATLLRVAVITWGVLISAAALVNVVALAKLSEQAQASAPGSQVAALEGRLTELGQRIGQAQQQPAALPQARYDTDRRALEQRLAVIEQTLGERLPADSLLPLQARIEQLEAKLTARPSPAASTRPRTPAKPKPIEPPFQVIGAELRAGERFVSILPSGAAALAQARLLRPGEDEAGWRLEAIDGAIAVFRHGEQTRRLPVPVR
ncbi:hypothetical protein C1I89_32805 [Achromobacter pulmonis]|uniref:Uncharacterized protein n=1 Tax=Achromobacter pulmonis TaxID=1389932 RepID=A0A2N8K8I6_9BURK|nr:hypothetical protein [Achromobacter pulmonis]MBO9333116.1 hypothetical protein [Achromobacter xylosoxidans]PND29766.1 hypothetical protein C1I89_32805 [Achromobacter pulmonis]